MISTIEFAAVVQIATFGIALIIAMRQSGDTDA